MAEYIDTIVDDLIINKLSRSKFNDLSSQGQLVDTELYLVGEDFLDAFGNRIVNVANPISASDAATKKYVDSSLSGIDFSSLSNIYIAATLSQNFTDSQKDLAGLNIGTRYKLLIRPTTYISELSGLSCSLEDYAVNTVSLSSDEYPLSIQFPSKPVDQRARDFLLRLEITCAEPPTISFLMPPNEEIDLESIDDWTSFGPGINYVSFTETKNGIIG